MLGQHLTNFDKSYIVQVVDDGEEIIHETGRRENCAVVELNGNDIFASQNHPFNNTMFNPPFGLFKVGSTQPVVQSQPLLRRR